MSQEQESGHAVRQGPSAIAGDSPRSVHEVLPRPSVATIDSILGKRFDVLDQGFVRVVDYMGSDAAIVQAARVSYGAGTKRIQEDRGLIRYLMRHGHTTPFEMCEIKFHVRVPMDAWRQWIRHRTANVNEYSTRYSVAVDAAQATAPGEWRAQAIGNKQGSSSFLESDVGAALSTQERELQLLARSVYEERLAAGVAREQARKDLPLSTYTEAYWKIDLHNLLRFLSLRMDAHAQLEIREYASVIGHELVSKWCPIAWDAFLEYQLGAMRLSRTELALAAALARSDSAGALSVAENAGWLERDATGALTPNRERRDAESKLAAIGQRVPW